MHKYGMWKPDTCNQTLPLGVFPMEEHCKKIQYSELYKNSTRLDDKINITLTASYSHK